jgi:CubicO group peptidase (beta-lactamase class C family)
MGTLKKTIHCIARSKQKMRITMITVLCLFFVQCGNKQKNEPLENNDQIQFINKADGLIQSYIDLDIFSGVVLVAQKGEVLYHKAFGLADRQKGIKNELNTLFDIGSMNKTFTSIVIHQLAAEGKLKITDKLTAYISGFSDPKAENITLNHLLEHSSGFGDYHSPDYFNLKASEQALHAIVERAKSVSLDFEPGTEEQYSNLGYVILGAVIEKVSGISYFDNVQMRIVDPLKLHDTFLNDFSGLDDRIAIGYYKTPLGILEENMALQDIPNPDGGFLSTTLDVMKFYRSYYYDELLLSKEVKKEHSFFQYLTKLDKGKATVAAGGFEGFNTAMFQVLSDDLTIIVFANMDEPVAERIGMDILTLYRNETPSKPQLPAIQNIRKNYEEHGLLYIKENFEKLTINYHPTDPKDLILNDLGYAYLYGANDKVKAMEIFKLNTQLFPDIANCWDSYGEALKANANILNAMNAYNKALELQPDLASAKKALDELKK